MPVLGATVLPPPLPRLPWRPFQSPRLPRASAQVSGHTSGGAGPRASSPPAPTSHGAWRLRRACCPPSDLSSRALGMGLLFQPPSPRALPPPPGPPRSSGTFVSLLFVIRFPVLTPAGPGPAFFPWVKHLVPITLSLLCWLPSNFLISACSFFFSILFFLIFIYSCIYLLIHLWLC